MNRVDVCAVSDIPVGSALRVMVGDYAVALAIIVGIAWMFVRYRRRQATA